jgi:hypothetical protein
MKYAPWVSALAFASVSLAGAPIQAQSVVTGPITGGDRGQPYGGFGQAGAPSGYVEEEWFLSGTATSYMKATEWRTDGLWDVTPDAREDFAVRMLVRRPADASTFNGVVVVEWLNVSGRSEGAADYMQMADELIRDGYAWIGVGAQAVGVHAPGTGLKAWDATRYAPLHHPGDRFSYDIFSQATRVVREPVRPDGPMGGLRPEKVIATGRSQSAFRLVTYVNAIQPRDRLFDGYFIHSRGGQAAGLTAEAMGGDPTNPVPDGARIRNDLGVPVFDLFTEGDMITLGAHRTRQPASAIYRRWEIAGAAHAEVPRWVVEVPPDLSRGPGCATPVNAAPHDAFVKAGLRALTDWVTAGVVPRQSPEILVGDATAPDPIRRDEHGNALGGVRIPEVEAPTATLNGLANSVAAGASGGLNFCFLYGNTLPFDAATLRTLYPTHQAYVDRFVVAVDRLERDGYLLPPEASEARAAATNSGIGEAGRSTLEQRQ